MKKNMFALSMLLVVIVGIFLLSPLFSMKRGFTKITSLINKNSLPTQTRFFDCCEKNEFEPSIDDLVESMAKLHLQQDLDANGVHLYCAERDEEAVKQIALANMHCLTSVPLTFFGDSKKYDEQLWKEDIKTALDSSNTSKVYRVNKNTVGFINYLIFEPRLNRFKPYHLGPFAIINHLAIDSKYRGNGYGKTLLKDALDDSKLHSAYKVNLTTTNPDLFNFYSNFGFRIRKSGTMGSSPLIDAWVLRLKPHPISIINWMLKLPKTLDNKCDYKCFVTVYVLITVIFIGMVYIICTQDEKKHLEKNA